MLAERAFPIPQDELCLRDCGVVRDVPGEVAYALLCPTNTERCRDPPLCRIESVCLAKSLRKTTAVPLQSLEFLP